MYITEPNSMVVNFPSNNQGLATPNNELGQINPVVDPANKKYKSI